MHGWSEDEWFMICIAHAIVISLLSSLYLARPWEEIFGSPIVPLYPLVPRGIWGGLWVLWAWSWPELVECILGF